MILGNSYQSVRLALIYEQQTVIVREYDAWLPHTTQRSIDMIDKFAFVTYGKVGDSAEPWNMHFFRDEAEDLGYANPNFFNTDQRLAWTLGPLLDDWWDNEMHSDKTAEELYSFYLHAQDIGANV